MKKQATKVIFRHHRGEVVALFPYIIADSYNGHVMSYASIGQHSAADYDGIIRDSRPAYLDEYANLKTELYNIGYHPIKVIQRMHRDTYTKSLLESRE